MSAEARPVVRSRAPGALLLFVVLTALVLVPWWRNHDILRDFYDYGLFIDANARIAQGERPFADFTTPAQSATFLLNSVAERLGGGTYLGMTRGAAAVIVVTLTLLGWALSRRWSPWLAWPVAAAIACAGAAQHTIVFYNPLGVLALALVTWSFAVAPLLHRSDLGWHLLAALGLFLGGLNKINYHVLACAMAAGWIVFGAVQRRAGIRPVLLAGAFVFFFGVVLPIATEVAWTGAGFRLWFYNVVQLPLSARGGRISLLFSPSLYLDTLHVFYGKLRIPQAGLVGLLLPLIVLIAAWRAPAQTLARRVLLVLAAIFAALAATALLLTNNEIAYLALSATLVLSVSLWLGFDLPTRSAWFFAGFFVPALLIGAAGWESAWLGQRSQFGHLESARASYLRGESISPDFGYVRGLRLPPEMAESLAATAAWRTRLPEADRRRIFYGPGCEWLEHIWPAPKARGLALVSSAFDGEREAALFHHEVLEGDRFGYILVPEPWDRWSGQTTSILRERFFAEKLGQHFIVYRRLAAGVLSARPLEYEPGIGGNVSSLVLVSTMPVRTLARGDRFVGIDHGEGELTLNTGGNRVSGEMVLLRPPGASAADAAVHFEAFAVEGTERYSRWKADLVLPAGQDELIVPSEALDASGLPVAFTVSVPDGLRGRIVAGWRQPRLLYVGDDSQKPPHLQNGAPAVGLMDSYAVAAFLPEALRGSTVYFCNATIKDGRIYFWAGGEVWIHLRGLFRNIQISTATDRPDDGMDWRSRFRVVHYIGGRLERFHPLTDDKAATNRFEAWSTQGDGWLGLLADPNRSNYPFTVRVESAERR